MKYEVPNNVKLPNKVIQKRSRITDKWRARLFIMCFLSRPIQVSHKPVGTHPSGREYKMMATGRELPALSQPS